MYTFPLLLLLCLIFPSVSSRTLPLNYGEPKSNLTEDKEVLSKWNLFERRASDDEDDESPTDETPKDMIPWPNVTELYKDYNVKNEADFEDVINGSFKTSGHGEGRFFYISLPTAICFLALMVGLCILTRPGGHCYDYFNRPPHVLCKHQQKTVDAVRRRYESTDSKRHARHHELMMREEKEEKKEMEQAMKQKERRAQQKERARKARKKAAERERAKQVKEREKLRKRKEKDMLVREKRKARLEEQQRELVRKREQSKRQGRGQFSQDATPKAMRKREPDVIRKRESDVIRKRESDVIRKRESDVIRKRDRRDDKGTKGRSLEGTSGHSIAKESRSFLDMARSLSLHKAPSSQVRIRGPPGEVRQKR